MNSELLTKQFEHRRVGAPLLRGAATRILSASPSHPATPGLEAPGTTLTFSLTISCIGVATQW